MVLKILEDDKTNNLNDIKVIESKIIKLNSRQDKLLDLQLDDKISNDIYLSKNNQIENEIK